MITKSQPGKGWEYARNPYWAKANAKAMPDLPDGARRQRSRSTVDPQPRRPRSTTSNRAATTGCRTRRPPDRYAEVKEKFEGTQFRVEPTISTYYFWMNTERGAVRRPQGPPGGQLRGRPGGAGTDLRRPARPAPSRSCRRGCPGYEKFELYPHDLAKAKEMIKEANPSDMDITVWTDTESPNNEAGEYYDERAQGTRLQHDAENPQRRQLLHGDRQRRRRPTSTPAGRTGSRTTRTRTTSSSRCCRAKASCRPTTATSPTSTTRQSTRRSPNWAKNSSGPSRKRPTRSSTKKSWKQAPWAPYGTRTLSTFVSDAIDLDKRHLQPDLRPVPDQLRIQVGRPQRARQDGATCREPQQTAPERAGPWSLALRRFLRNRLAVAFLGALRPDRPLRPRGAAVGRPRRPHRAEPGAHAAKDHRRRRKARRRHPRRQADRAAVVRRRRQVLPRRRQPARPRRDGAADVRRPHLAAYRHHRRR